MKGEEDSWRSAYQDMRGRAGEGLLVWSRPALLEIPPDMTVGKGEDSEEVKVQRAREAQELMVIFKDIRMVPESPREPSTPEMDYDDGKTTIIPWDDHSLG